MHIGRPIRSWRRFGRAAPRISALALAFFAADSLGLPQAPPQDGAEIQTREAPAAFKTKVNLVSVAVTVRDASGRALGNLSTGDFELSEDGKPQVKSRFSVQRFSKTGRPETSPDSGPPLSESAASAQSIPERFVLYLFDDVHLDPRDLPPLREAALQVLAAPSPGSAQRFAIYTTSG